MDGYELRTAEKRSALLKAAGELFTSRGLAAVAVSDIAAAAGTSTMTIYNYFGSKQGLAVAVIEQMMDEGRAAFMATVDGDEPFADKVQAVMGDKLAAVVTESRNRFSQEAFEDKELRSLLVSASRRESRALYFHLVEVGRSSGSIRPDLSDEALLAYFDAFAGLMLRPDFTSGTDDEYKRGLFQLFMKGLIGR